MMGCEMTLQGNRTYILAALAAVVTFVKYLGYIDDSMYQTLIGLLGAGAVATLRASVSDVSKKLIIILCLALGFSNVLLAQTPTVKANAPVTFAADHNGVETTHYNIMEGTVQKATVQASAQVGGVVTIVVQAGFPKGTHTVVMQACGDGGCADSLPLVFVVVPEAPTPPVNLRITR